ncbi:MAG: hypothetical protein O7G85_12110, partial [Planctomycetota bacterium]|nr:hypothetical protein [Planctomycetota bacterium]
YYFSDASGSLALLGCTFQNNHGNSGGGIFFFTSNSPTLLDCQFVNNTSQFDGAGIYGLSNAMSVTNCLFSINESLGFATFGGGVLADGGSPTITNSTFYANHSGTGGGVHIASGSLTLENCILWANSDHTPGTLESEQIAYAFAPPTVNYSDIQGLTSSWGSMNTNADPMFADELGPDLSPKTGDEDLRLTASSTALLDTGSNAAIAGIGFDLDGNVRIQNGDVDMGPYEFSGIIDSDNDGLSDDDELMVHFTDPFNPDTDGDGLWDGTEIDMAMGETCPDPLDRDSDDDGISDGDEVTAMTNPCVASGDVPSDDLLVNLIRLVADGIEGIDLSGFNGPNDNANAGRRNSLASRVNQAANALAKGKESSALNLLMTVLEKVDDHSPPPDWMDSSPEKSVLRNDLETLIALILL